MTDSRWEQGMTVRRAVLGDEHVDRATARTTPFTADFQEFITRYAWGEVWSRPGDEIKEVLLHAAVYAGVPAANTAFALAEEVLAEAGDAGR